jgi:hypothetical protein
MGIFIRSYRALFSIWLSISVAHRQRSIRNRVVASDALHL